MPVPFDSYKGGGRRLLGKPASGNGSSRRGYGLMVSSTGLFTRKQIHTVTFMKP